VLAELRAARQPGGPAPGDSFLAAAAARAAAAGAPVLAAAPPPPPVAPYALHVLAPDGSLRPALARARAGDAVSDLPPAPPPPPGGAAPAIVLALPSAPAPARSGAAGGPSAARVRAYQRSMRGESMAVEAALAPERGATEAGASLPSPRRHC
jgi:hypothetical protein